MKTRSLLISVASLSAVVTFAACKNTLQFGNNGSRDCNTPGTICSIGAQNVGDGTDPLKAAFASPNAITDDGSGGFYVADTQQNRIRHVDAQGKVSTLAGTGRYGSDFVSGVPGTSADIAAPYSVTASPDGWVYWADLDTCNIYGVNPSNGTVSIVAGAGVCSAGGDGPEPGSALTFGGCGKISADSRGNLIVTENYYRVRYLNRSNADVTVWGVLAPAGAIKTIAGRVDYTSQVTLGADGVNALTGNGIAYYPCQAAEGPDGNLWIADTGHNAVRMVDSSGLIYTMIGGNGPGAGGDGGSARLAQLNTPGGVRVDALGNVFVEDVTGRVRMANFSGANETLFGAVVGSSQITTIAGGGAPFLLMSDGGPALSQSFAFGAGAPPLVDANGDLLVADPGNGVIRKVDHATGTMSVAAGFAPGGTLATYLQAPAGVAVDDAGTVYVNARNARLNRLDAAGQATVFAGTGSPVASGDGGPASAAGYWGTALAYGPDKALYIADPRGHRIRKIDSSGVINNVAGTGASGSGGDGGPAISAQFVGPFGLAFDASGNLFVTDAERVRFINLGSATTTIAGVSIVPGNIDTIAGKNGNGGAGDGGPALSAQFNFNVAGTTDSPNGMAVYQNGLYVADYRNSRIRRIDLDTGIVTNVVGSGAPTAAGVGHPVGLAVLNGYLYWTQQDGSMVKRMKLPLAPVEVVAGDGFAGSFGDNGGGTDAELVQPQGLTVGPDGALYVADGSHRVRRIVP